MSGIGINVPARLSEDIKNGDSRGTLTLLRNIKTKLDQMQASITTMQNQILVLNKKLGIKA